MKGFTEFTLMKHQKNSVHESLMICISQTNIYYFCNCKIYIFSQTNIYYFCNGKIYIFVILSMQFFLSILI